MKSALVRLFVISTTTLFLLFGAIFWLRFLGTMQEFAPLNHPLLQQTGTWHLLKLPPSHPTPESFKDWHSSQLQKDSIIPWLDLRRTLDGHWILAPLEWVEVPQGKVSVHYLNLNEVQDHWPEGQPIHFTQILEIVGERALWLNIIEKDIYWIKDWQNLIPNNLTQKVIISSPGKQFGKKLREAQPDWLYAGDTATLSQLTSLESIFLETIGNYWADIFYASKNDLKRSIFSERIIKELQRRKLPVVVELTENTAINNTLLSLPDLKFKGLVSESEAEIESALSLSSEKSASEKK